MRLINAPTILAACLLTTSALAGDPDPKEIVAAADKAAKAVTAVSYDARVWGEKALKDAISPFSARVKIRAGAEGGLGDLRIDVAGDEDQNGVTVVMDEKNLLVLDRRGKSALIAKRADADPLARQTQAMLALMLEFVHPAPYDEELAGDSIAYEGRKEIGGVPCHVIHVVYKNRAHIARWYFGVDDNLPHRVDRFYETKDGEGVRILELKNLNTSPEFDKAVFDTKSPAGFETSQFEPEKPKSTGGLLEVGAVAPDWTLKTSGGDEVTLSKLRGKVVVLDFWATWCGPCKKAMPSVQKLHEHFKGKPVRVFGVDVWEGAKGDPAGYMKENGFTYTLLMKGDELAKSYQFNGIPTFYIIGPDGRVLYASTGFRPEVEAELTGLIEKALE